MGRLWRSEWGKPWFHCRRHQALTGLYGTMLLHAKDPAMTRRDPDAAAHLIESKIAIRLDFKPN